MSTAPSVTSTVSSSASVVTTRSLPSSEDILNELLVLPQAPPSKTGRRRKAINDKAKEVTDASVLQEMKDKAQNADKAKKMKEEKKIERARKAREKQAEKERKKLEWENEAQERKEKKESKKAKKLKRAERTPSPTDTARLESLFTQLDVEDDGQCFSCGMAFSQEHDEDRYWVCCDRCDNWCFFACHKFPTKDSVPDKFYCMKCRAANCSLVLLCMSYVLKWIF